MNRTEVLDSGTRLSDIDWSAIESDLDIAGCAILKGILSPETCSEISAMYGDDSHFRKRVVMARHGFGRGEYKYLRYPLPELVAELRSNLYSPLARIANRWNETLGEAHRFPATHDEYLKQCRAAGQN